MAPQEIDGSTVSGGGQVLRVLVGSAALTKTPIHTTKIRADRRNPDGTTGGLKRHDLTAVEWLADACEARAQGMELGSQDLIFVPGLDCVCEF